MVDVNSHQFIKSKHEKNVLVPQPSNDPHDPLVKLSVIFTAQDCLDFLLILDLLFVFLSL